jgi:hypothetical protein
VVLPPRSGFVQQGHPAKRKKRAPADAQRCTISVFTLRYKNQQRYMHLGGVAHLFEFLVFG